jgi:hypothetical protein
MTDAPPSLVGLAADVAALAVEVARLGTVLEVFARLLPPQVMRAEAERVSCQLARAEVAIHILQCGNRRASEG